MSPSSPFYWVSIGFLEVCTRAGTVCSGHPARSTSWTAVLSCNARVSEALAACNYAIIGFLLFFSNCWWGVLFWVRQVKGTNIFFFFLYFEVSWRVTSWFWLFHGPCFGTCHVHRCCLALRKPKYPVLTVLGLKTLTMCVWLLKFDQQWSQEKQK